MDALPSVFLSYARGDDEAFVARLRRGLEASGVSVWFDRDSLPSRGLTFVQEIRDAIHSRDRLVLILGPAALSSSYVEAEWRYALEAAKVVVPVVTSLSLESRISDALPRELSRLQVVDARGRGESDVLGDILRHLRQSEPRLGSVLHVPPPPPHYQPRRLNAAQLESALQLDRAQRLTAQVRQRTLVLHGMGGVGKSVAAAAVARNIHVRRQFSSGVVWVELGREPDVLAGLRRVGAAVADDLRDYARVEDTVPRLTKAIGDAPLLIVADNAWRDEDLAPFVAIMGSATRLLVTTRDRGIATRLGAESISIDPLTSDEAVNQLADWVGTAVDLLPESAHKVAHACGGLPLALAVVGAMALGETPWEDILAAIDEADLGFLEERLPDYPFPNLLRALRASLDALENSEDELLRVAGTCFRQLAALRWDRPVPEATLVTLWTVRSQLSEKRARRVLSVLAAKALIRTEQDAPRRVVSLHDLLHDLARALVPDLAQEHGALIDAYSAKDQRSPFIADDGYLLEHFAYHLEAAGRGAELPAILCRDSAGGANAWWTVRLENGQVSGYVADVQRALDDAEKREDTAAVVRWALMIASARSAVGGVPPIFAALLLARGTWTPAQALAAADWASGSGRFEMLVAALPFLPADQRDTVAEEAALLARREPEEADRARRLLDLASALDGAPRRQFVSEALPPNQPVPSHVSVRTMLRAWQLDPSRTDAADGAVAHAQSQADGVVDGVTLQHLAESAPATHLARVRQLADQLVEPSDRLKVLLALAERGYEPLEELVREAEVELARVPVARVAHQLEAQLIPFRSEPSRAASVHAVVTDGDQRPRTDRLFPLLAVLPFTSGDDRSSAESQVFEILEKGGTESDILVASEAGRRLRETDPELFGAFLDQALSSMRETEDSWSRTSGVARILAEMGEHPSRAVLEDEAKRMLTIDDQRARSGCLSAFAARMEADAAERAVRAALHRMIKRLRADELTSAASPLLACAAAEDIAAFQAARGQHIRFDLDVRPALFGAWARLGDWDAALSALDGGSAYEIECAVDPLSEVIPQVIAEELVGAAIDLGDPTYYSAVAGIIPRLREDHRRPVVELGFEALDALDNPYDCLRLIRRLAPLLPVEGLPRIAASVPHGAGAMDRDEARLVIARAWIAYGDRIAAADEVLKMEIAEYSIEAMLLVAQVAPPNERDLWVEVVRQRAATLHRREKVKALVALADLDKGPERTRLLREATRAAEAHDEQNLAISEERADALRIVAAARSGAERERLLLSAWDAAPKGGSWVGVATLTALAPLIAETPSPAARARWQRSLEVATRSRSAVLQELTAMVDVVASLGGLRTVADVVIALDDVDRWWP